LRKEMGPLKYVVAGGVVESIPAAGIYHAEKRASKDKFEGKEIVKRVFIFIHLHTHIYTVTHTHI